MSTEIYNTLRDCVGFEGAVDDIVQELSELFSINVRLSNAVIRILPTGSRCFGQHESSSNYDIVLYSTAFETTELRGYGYSLCREHYPNDLHNIYRKVLSSGINLNLICTWDEVIYRKWLLSTLITLDIQKSTGQKLDKTCRKNLFSTIIDEPTALPYQG